MFMECICCHNPSLQGKQGALALDGGERLAIQPFFQAFFTSGLD